jgi:hypothetical protein
MQRYIDLFGAANIDCLLDDREFIGDHYREIQRVLSIFVMYFDLRYIFSFTLSMCKINESMLYGINKKLIIYYGAIYRILIVVLIMGIYICIASLKSDYRGKYLKSVSPFCIPLGLDERR